MPFDDVIHAWLQLLRLSPVAQASALSPEQAVQFIPMARHELVLPWYWHRLRLAGLLPKLPADQQEEMRRFGIATTTQRLKIEVGTSQVARLLHDHGIQVVLLKGVAYAALGDRFPFLAYRETADADLLVAPGFAETAWHLLLENGFRQAPDLVSVHEDHHHLPLLVGPNAVRVEVHTSASLFISPETSWQRFGESAQRVQWRGAEVFVPPQTELLWHAIAHSLGDGAEGCRLRHLLTVAALMSRPEGIDWDVIARRLHDDNVRFHDSRRSVPLRGVRRWLTAAAWFADVEPPREFHDPSDTRTLLTRLLKVKSQYLRPPDTKAVVRNRSMRVLEESTAAAFALGTQYDGHWQPGPRRLRHAITSAFLQLAYRVQSPLA